MDRRGVDNDGARGGYEEEESLRRVLTTRWGCESRVRSKRKGAREPQGLEHTTLGRSTDGSTGQSKPRAGRRIGELVIDTWTVAQGQGDGRL